MSEDTTSIPAATDFVEVKLADGRIAGVVRYETSEIGIGINNPADSGRLPMGDILLTEESFKALYVAMSYYVQNMKVKLDEWVSEKMDNESVQFRCGISLAKEGAKLEIGGLCVHFNQIQNDPLQR